MRTTQRNFVVEYKNRRQAQARSPSIWGNLDLRAVALQIENDGVLPDAVQSAVQSTADPGVPDLKISPSNEPRVPTGTILAGEDDLPLQGLTHEFSAIDTSPAHDKPPIADRSAHSSKPDKRASIQARA